MLTKEVEVELTNNIKYYEDLGYNIPRYLNDRNQLKVKNGTTLVVNIKDLPLNSHALVDIECDYCKITHTISYKSYNNRHKDIINKDCCGNCISKKSIESNLLIYGVRSTMQIPEVSNQIKLNYDYIKKRFEERGYILISTEYIHNTLPLQFICKKHIDKGIQEIIWTQFNRGFGCNYCSYDQISKGHSGENNPNWKGGISSLHAYLRDELKQWKIDSLQFYNYRCGITNISCGNLNIHHKYAFNLILKEVLNILDMEIRDNFTLYTKEELEIISKLIIEKHYEYGLGIPLLPSLHNFYHNIYGKGNNTPQQFQEFVRRYYNFEFDELLDDNYKYCNILKAVS
jgi:hypothetical protein